jgi:hypothetical protein
MSAAPDFREVIGRTQRERRVLLARALDPGVIVDRHRLELVVRERDRGWREREAVTSPCLPTR